MMNKSLKNKKIVLFELTNYLKKYIRIYVD